MTLHVLDTDMLTLLEEGHPAAGRRFLQERPEDVATTVLTVEEQLTGWYTQVRKAKRPERLAWACHRLADTIGSWRTSRS
jgi:tRNA(fMet)-specific endonuclease VapC